MKKKSVLAILMILCLLGGATFGGVAVSQRRDAENSEAIYASLRASVAQNDDASQTLEGNSSSVGTEHGISTFERYKPLYEANNDFVGWISIDGTNIDYPVVQSIHAQDYYLDHSFEKKASAYGVPYVDEACAIDQSNNVILYGHNMKDGSMFHDLLNYADRDFYAENPTIRFDTFWDYGTYEVIAAFRFDVRNEDFFFNEYHDMSETEFTEFIDNCKERNLYDTVKTAEYGDYLLTLCTCEYTYDDGRFVVVARKL